MNSLLNSATALLSITFPNYALKLACIGGIITAAIFVIAFLISLPSKMNALRKKLKILIDKLARLQKIDENNVSEIYDGMKDLPAGVKKGWGNFLDQRNGYPSDYMQAKDCIGGSEYSGKVTLGKIVYVVSNVIMWAVLAVLAVNEVTKADAVVNIGTVATASVASAVLVPAAVFAIGYVGLYYIYANQKNRLDMFYSSMQDILDEKTMVTPKAKEEYVAESLEDIAAKVDALIDGRLDEDGVIEVLRLPDGIEEEIPATVEEPVEEPAAEEEEEEESELEEEKLDAVKVESVDDGIGDIVYPDEEEEEAAPAEKEEFAQKEEALPEQEEEQQPVEEDAVGQPEEEQIPQEFVQEEVVEETVPEEEAAEEVEEVAEEEVVEETVEEAEPEVIPEPEPIILTAEEEKRYLSILPGVVEKAVNDPETTLRDLEELAELIENARLNNFKEQADQDILIECLCTIADKYYQ